MFSRPDLYTINILSIMRIGHIKKKRIQSLFYVNVFNWLSVTSLNYFLKLEKKFVSVKSFKVCWCSVMHQFA